MSRAAGCRRWLAILGLALALPACAPRPPQNLVFISLDTTRRDHLSVYGYERQTTPALERLARRGALFANAFAQQNRTLPSHASMLTGLYPHGHGSVSNKHPLDAGRTTLAETLGAADFRTAAFVNGYTLKSKWGLAQGFEVYDDDFEGISRRGELALRRATRWLQARAPDERFFLFLHLYDAHGPYQIPPGGRIAFKSETRGPRLEAIPKYQQLHARGGEPLVYLGDYVDRYDSLLLYQDEIVASLLDEIDLETTLVVVVADHGETLGERARPLNHGASLYEEEIRIPLLVAGPGVAARHVETPAETVDLMPTLLDLLAVPMPAAPRSAPAGELDGTSLAPLLRRPAGGRPAGGRPAEGRPAEGRPAEGRPAERRSAQRAVFASSVAEPDRYRDRGYELDVGRQIQAVRARGFKLIVYPNATEDYLELYRLADDPLERRNVADEYPRARAALLAELERWNPAYGKSTPEVTVTEEELDNLRSLGYVP